MVMFRMFLGLPSTKATSYTSNKIYFLIYCCYATIKNSSQPVIFDRQVIYPPPDVQHSAAHQAVDKSRGFLRQVIYIKNTLPLFI